MYALDNDFYFIQLHASTIKAFNFIMFILKCLVL